MASTKLLVGMLGIVLAFAPELLYDAYDTGGLRWGMTPLDDQRVAGLIMACRAVDRHGHRARLALRPDAERVREGGRAGAERYA